MQRQRVVLSVHVQSPVLLVPEPGHTLPPFLNLHCSVLPCLTVRVDWLGVVWAGEGTQRLLIVELGELSFQREDEDGGGDHEPTPQPPASSSNSGSSQRDQPALDEDRWRLGLANVQVRAAASACLRQSGCHWTAVEMLVLVMPVIRWGCVGKRALCCSRRATCGSPPARTWSSKPSTSTSG